MKAENTDKRHREEGSTGVLLHPPKASSIRSSVMAKRCSSTPILGFGPLHVKPLSKVRMGRGKMTFAKA